MKSNGLGKIIINAVIFILILAVTIKIAMGLLKIGCYVLLIWLIYKGVKELIKYIKKKKENISYEKKGYKINDDGIVDVKFEETDK
ncbi:hypothetical protein ACER0A_010400 [Haloimpatiens sp. FM7315]|uniref:hypothetical protein n=1 Tax=Haloimpatiens sp. FM7315 TaxID=3298609 RepID=UPI00370AFDC1